MNEICATRALIDVFETETQYSEPERTFLWYRVSNLSTERERLRESRGADLRRIKDLERENRHLSR
jgi:hypothetical protein